MTLQTTEPDMLGRVTEVYLTKRSVTTYDKKTVFEVVPREDLIKYGLVTPNVSAIQKYEREHGVDLKGTPAYSKEFLAARAKK